LTISCEVDKKMVKKGRVFLIAAVTLTASLGILATVSLPIVAQQSKRYPTENELQQLMKGFRNFATAPPEGSRGFYRREPRNAAQSRDREAFVRAWLPVNPELAPFLGQWTALEETTNIYPSSIRGRACVVETFIPPPNDIGISFARGTVSGKSIKTNNFTIILQQGNYLGVAFTNTLQRSTGHLRIRLAQTACQSC
jgi:hypothetical protein